MQFHVPFSSVFKESWREDEPLWFKLAAEIAHTVQNSLFFYFVTPLYDQSKQKYLADIILSENRTIFYLCHVQKR
jgi:hypothetical protein